MEESTMNQPMGTSHFVELRGVRFAYTDVGSGPIIVYAHGLSSSRANDALMGLADFSTLRSQFRLISYDARGHGRSAGTTDSADYTWPALADDLIALTEYFSPDSPVSVIGSSMGTGTALHAVVKAPQRFDRLVLTAPPTAWATRAGQTEMYATMADLAQSSPPDVLATLFSQAEVAPIFADVPGFPPPPDVAHELLPIVFRGAGRSDLPSPDVLRSIEQPTLVLAWASDPGHPVSTAERLIELIPDSRLHVSETSDDIRTWGTRAAEFLVAQPAG
jgi:3-oxoadipate enol-lactonase